MIYTRHSHCFSKCQLQLIIDDYLTLRPYYRILIQALKGQVKKFEAETSHPKQKAHPIRVYTRDYQWSKNFFENEDSNSMEARIDLRSTYASGCIRYYYLFPLEYIIQILQSSQFYQLLPSNLIINGLLTTTNLQIIIQTLNIVSEDMCKKIRSTIAGKELRSTEHPTKENTVIEETKTFKNRQPVSEVNFDFESKIEIQVEPENQGIEGENKIVASKVSKTSLWIPNQMLKREIIGTTKFINIDKEIADQSCRFCEGYLIYLYETVGPYPLDNDINHLSTQSFRCLNIISKVVPHFTIHLTENNLTHIPNDIYTINKVLNSIGLVLTEDIFSSELNPRAAKPPAEQASRPRNLIQELQPYFGTLSKKKRPTEDYSIEELFRMIVYAPTIQEVKDKLKNQQSEQFEKQKIMKNMACQRGGKLLKKECKEMEEFEAERLTILKHRIETKPVFKIINVEEQKKQKVHTSTSKPTLYNVFNPSKSITKTVNNISNIDRVPTATTQNKVQSKVSGKYYIKGDAYKNIKTKKQKDNDLIYPEFNTMAMSTVLKKSTIKYPPAEVTPIYFSPTAPNFYSPNTLCFVVPTSIASNVYSQTQKLTTYSTQGENQATKSTFNQTEQEEELTNEQFKKMLYNAYSRRNHATKNDNNYLTGHNSPNHVLASNTPKSQLKKMGSYNSSLSHFIGRKKEQEEMDCMEKRQKELYNKQLLNGEFVRNEIYEELERDEADIFEDYYSLSSLNETLRLENGLRAEKSPDTGPTGRTYQHITSKSSKKRINIIEQNSTKFNQSGILRNQKYAKSIKRELINNRLSCLRNEGIHENKNKVMKQIQQRLTQPSCDTLVNVKKQYEKELKLALQKRKEMNQVEKMLKEHADSDDLEILL